MTLYSSDPIISLFRVKDMSVQISHYTILVQALNREHFWVKTYGAPK